MTNLSFNFINYPRVSRVLIHQPAQDCYCGGREIPGGYSPDQIPQFVLLTFDDAVNDLNKQFYEDLFGGRYNPNGCPIKATFYVSHEWTDYAQVRYRQIL